MNKGSHPGTATNYGFGHHLAEMTEHDLETFFLVRCL